MNILIAAVSTFSPNSIERKYELRIQGATRTEITAKHTNESILRALVSIDSVNEAGGIGKVVLVVSDKTKVIDKAFEVSPLDYIKTVIEECGLKPQYVLIDAEQPTEMILGQICAEIAPNDTVYIDSAGGPRNTANIIQVLPNMLKYLGIKNPINLYSNIQNRIGFVQDTSEFTIMTDLANAFNEFMTTGKSDQLNSCFGEKTESEELLLSAMTEFSDKIRLGNVDTMEETVQKLHQALQQVGAERPNTLQSVILHQFTLLIEKRLVGEGSSDVDYLRIIGWCLDNMLIQQALTIIVEKIAIYLYNNHVIGVKHNEGRQRKEYPAKKSKNKTLPSEWETYILVNGIMKTPVERLVDECRFLLSQPGKHSVNKNATAIVKK